MKVQVMEAKKMNPNNEANPNKLKTRLGQGVRNRIAKRKEPIEQFKENRDIDKAPKLKDRLRLTLNEEREAELNKFLTELMPEIRQERHKKLNDLSILIANFIKWEIVAVSRNNSFLRRYSYLSGAYIEIIDEMENRGYIALKRSGFRNATGGRLTRYGRTNKLSVWIENLPEIPQQTELLPHFELVQLKDGKSKKLKNYKDTKKTKEIRSQLQRINELNEKACITSQGEKVSVHLHAVFIDNFQTYGRLHTSGAKHVQGYSKGKRSELKINGEAVVEWDYTGLHPNLLYASAGIQLNGDPYTVVDNRNELRPFLKHILLCMINCKSKDEAEGAANNWLEIDSDKDTQQLQQTKEDLKSQGIKSALPFMEKFEQAHKSISNYFYNGQGNKIMNKDAKIALEICSWFVEKEIPIIPIHDSFIVQTKYEEKLKKMMKRVYKKQTGFDIEIKKNS